MGALGEVKSLSQKFLHRWQLVLFPDLWIQFSGACLDLVGSFLGRSVFSPAELDCKSRHGRWVPEASHLWGA